MDQPTTPVSQPMPVVKKANKGASFVASLKAAWSELKLWQKIISVIVAVVFLFVFYVVLDANKYPALVHVIGGQGKVGINPTDKALDFGDLATGTSAVRRVNLKNGTFMPMYVIVVKTGRVSELMKLDKNYFTLKPGEDVKLSFTTYMPASGQVGAWYKGRVYLFKIPTFWL